MIRRHLNLYAGVLLLMLAFSALAGAEAYRSYRSELDQARQQARTLARAIEELTNATVHRADLSLSQVQSVLNARGQSAHGSIPRSLIRDFDAIARQLPEIEALGVSDADGMSRVWRRLGGEGAGEEGPVVSIADRPYFLRLKRFPEAGLVISEPVVSRVTGNLILSLCRRVARPDRVFGGVILATLNVEGFSKLFETLELQPGSSVALLNFDQVVLARQPFVAPVIGKRVEMPQEMMDGLRRGMASVDFVALSPVDGRERIYSVRKVGDFPLLVIVGQGKAETLRVWRERIVVVAAFMLLLTVLALLAVRRHALNLDEAERQRQIAIQAMKFSSLGEMAAGIAHEINNPLAIISARMAQIRMLLEKSPPDVSATIALTDKVNDVTQRIARIVRGLRQFARSEENEEGKPSTLKQIVEGVLDLSTERSKAHRIRIELQPVPELELVCNETQITQVLINLLNNAFDAIAELPEKWVRLEFRVLESEADSDSGAGDRAETRGKRRVEIRITDSGPGIPPEIAAKLMQPFFTTKPVGQGTGLGLSISKGIMESHGGALRLDPGSPNTCFVLELPIL